MIYSQICVNSKILGKNENDWAKGEYKKLKRGSWNAPVLTKARPNSPKPDVPRGSRPSEITSVTLGLFHVTRPGEPNNTQAISHLS